MVEKISYEAKSASVGHIHSLTDKAMGYSIPQIGKISTQLAVAIVASLLCNWLHVPVAWLIGPMVVGIAYGVIGGNPQPLPPAFMLVGQAVIAIATAAGFVTCLIFVP